MGGAVGRARRRPPTQGRSAAGDAQRTDPVASVFGGGARVPRPTRTGGGAGWSAAADPLDAADETGLERDDRIDRLIVSRLRRSSLSVSEVRRILVEHGLDEAEVEEWIERYERLGYLDDRRLAEQLVHSHGARRGRGSGALLHELGRRGIDDELAREAVDTLDPDVEFEHALLIAERRARQLGGLDRRVAERRLSAFLMRRGYGSELVRRAVAAALDGEDAE
ncbi:regulatory protein RecX [Agromyces sp. ZXT2-3]|uniref:regulatory protein RecX n=1 Tax=Agromyces sp. ZXT2-3 TaxID=3461152 RepID=UPI004054FD82